jgi:hypothetical protein
MDKHTPRSEIGASERAEIFHDQFGNDLDAGETLAKLVIAAGDYLSRIIGREDADAGMARIVERVVEVSGTTMTGPSEWRSALDHSSSNCYSEWELGSRLHDLAAYALYGIVLDGSDNEAVLAERIEEQVKEAEQFVAATPVNWLDGNSNSDLFRLVRLASNRWALDNGRPIEAVALAEFGGVSEGRIRNMMSGANKAFSSKDSQIPADEALKWLAGRPEFWTSIWREQSLPQYAREPSAPFHQAAFVPVARDGSMFHPGLQRASSYTIGKKGTEVQVADFYGALAQLQRMPVPYWRRPNSSGNWGIVAGVRWERVETADLKMPSANQGHALAQSDLV